MEERLLAILRLAILKNATDVHFTLQNNQIDIYMRIDGQMRRVKALFGDDKLLRYLQYLANLDIGNLNSPQTGQFELELDNNLLSLRFACVHTFNLTNGVLRILNNSLKLNSLKLSLYDFQNAFFQKLTNKENGLVLFAGPTGSGKTTTLYSLLSNIKDKMIYSIEDPIEVYNSNIVQLQVNEKNNFDYESGIKQILRHDPDIIMIGEIRDERAAKMALRAANTGHLVFSTIHASSASKAIGRMVDLGVNENMLLEMLVGLIYQRMIINRSGEKVVLYEIMDEEELFYFKDNHHNSTNFLNVDLQIKEGIANGIF